MKRLFLFVLTLFFVAAPFVGPVFDGGRRPPIRECASGFSHRLLAAASTIRVIASFQGLPFAGCWPRRGSAILRPAILRPAILRTAILRTGIFAKRIQADGGEIAKAAESHIVLRYVGMTKPDTCAAKDRIRALADFRFRLRKFLHFSEEAASHVGLTAQQHQLLLQIAGAPEGAVTAVGYLADRLVLRHHSVVELSNRCQEAGLIVRKRNPRNRRHVMLELTPAGNRILMRLSVDHACELNELGPQLIQTLRKASARAPQPGRVEPKGRQ